MAGIQETVLQPITEFSAQELAARLVELRSRSSALLATRYILGPLERYKDQATAEESVNRASHLHMTNTQSVYIPVGDKGDPEGIATIYPGLRLRKLRLPIPRGLPNHRQVQRLRRAVGLLDKVASKEWWLDYHFADPNISAWTTEGQEELLAKAYRELDKITMPHGSQDPAPRAWTIEPVRSPKAIHEAIDTTSLKRIARARWDDDELKSRVPPRSVLYARLRYAALTARGEKQELRSDKKPFLQELDEKEQDGLA